MFFRKLTSSTPASGSASSGAAGATGAAAPAAGTNSAAAAGATSAAAKAAKGTPQINFEQQWNRIQEGVNRLIDFLDSGAKRPFDAAGQVDLFTIVYDLCTKKVDTGRLTGGPTELLYDRYKRCIAQYLQDRVVPALKQKQGEVLMMDAVRKWRDHIIVVKWMQKLFQYLDRYYTKHNNRDSLRDVGLKCFQQYVYESVKKDMSTALLHKIYQERVGEQVDRSVLKDGVNLFIEMGLNTLNAYEKDFEQALIKDTSDFYKRESAKYIAENTVPDYMRKAEQRLDEEHARCRSYLHQSTEPTLIKKVEFELISVHAQKILEMENSGLVALLKDHKREDLARMYRLFNRVKDLKPMADMLRDFIRDEGMSIVNAHQEKEELDCSAYISALLDLHTKYSDLVSVEFQKDALFLEALKDAFTHFVNTDLVNKKKNTKTSTAELLSTYCDTIMKSTEKVGEENLDDLLERIVKLFGYISDKDMFQEFYRRQLSKRLLLASTPNYEAERQLIAKLKIRCGASFTSKLEGMIKDKNLSEDLQNAFEEFVKSKNKELSIDFSPKVLTTGFWPSFKIDQLTVPEEFGQCLSVFKEFYDSRTESRTLKWVHSLGSCQVLARYQNGDKDLQVSTYQACILLMFNNLPEGASSAEGAEDGEGGAGLTLQDVQKALNLPLDDVKKNLLSLSANKLCQILKKSGANQKSIAPTDVFTVNVDFESKTRRIKVPSMAYAISETERTEIDKTTQEDRKHAIEAAIVRIMKSRKKMDHQSLVLETSKQLMAHFKPDPKDIKRRIEDLITREYLARDETAANTYNYLA